MTTAITWCCVMLVDFGCIRGVRVWMHRRHPRGAVLRVELMQSDVHRLSHVKCRLILAGFEKRSDCCVVFRRRLATAILFVVDHVEHFARGSRELVRAI